MKGKKLAAILVLSVLFISLMTGVFSIAFLQLFKQEEVTTVEAKDITMFSAYTEIEEFQEVPVMVTEQGKIYDPEDYGDGNYLVNVSGSTEEEYMAYLNTLEQAGFKKHSDNGEDAMEGYAHSAAFTKDNLTVTVSHAIQLDHTYISASFDLPLSDHLIYKDEYMEGVSPNAKTKLHMMQLNDEGNCFIIQLKNGHFVVEDGGRKYDTPYLLDYLESLTPEGEIPVIEGWFISHAHGDHEGSMLEIAKNMSYLKRIYVEGFYYSEPSAEVLATLDMQDGTQGNWYTVRSAAVFKSTSGEAPKMYRTQFGQRYYFCDMTIDVSLTVEQFRKEAYWQNDFNDTSTWLMHTIEGQRFLCAGDTRHTGFNTAMNIYDETYFDMDIFATPHHGINLYQYFLDYCTFKTVLYTNSRAASLWEPSRTDLAQVAENEYLRTHCDEYYSHGEGTVVLTFPYKVGTAEILEPVEWKYNNGRQKKVWE